MNSSVDIDVPKGQNCIPSHPVSSVPKHRILLDLLAYGPNDGGFTTSVNSLLESAKLLPEFEFGLLHHRDYRDYFSRWPFTRHEAVCPRPLKFMASLWITPRVVQRHGYAAVHADISLLSPWLGVPGSIRVHDLYFLLNPSVSQRNPVKRAANFVYERLLVRSIRRAAVVGAISECTRRDIGRLVGRTQGGVLLPHAIPSPAGLVQPAAWPEIDQPLKLLFVGSVVPRKNIRVLLQALRQVKRSWALDIVGNIWWGSASIKDYSGDSRVHIRGFVSDSELREYYRKSHVLVIPSLYEGFGLPAAEAISAGCLALTSSGSGFDEYIPAECRFDPNTPTQLSALLDRLDQQSAAKLWRASSEAIKQYTLEAQTRAYATAFRKLLSCESGNSPQSVGASA